MDFPSPASAFPATRHSVIRALRSDDAATRQRAFDTLVASYWQPVFQYLRRRWRMADEDAEDLTQEFFASAFEKEFLGGHDPSRARFRTFLRVCVDRAAMNARESASRLKRGGHLTSVSADQLTPQDEALALASTDSDMEEFFRQEWIRALFVLAVERLRDECATTGKQVQFALFERYDVEGPGQAHAPTYSELALQHGIPETQVTNHLAFARRRLRHHVLQVLAEITATDDELAAEARDILGVSIS